MYNSGSQKTTVQLYYTRVMPLSVRKGLLWLALEDEEMDALRLPNTRSK